jgi:hypothetical protein
MTTTMISYDDNRLTGDDCRLPNSIENTHQLYHGKEIQQSTIQKKGK